LTPPPLTPLKKRLPEILDDAGGPPTDKIVTTDSPNTMFLPRSILPGDVWGSWETNVKDFENSTNSTSFMFLKKEGNQIVVLLEVL